MVEKHVEDDEFSGAPSPSCEKEHVKKNKDIDTLIQIGRRRWHAHCR